MVKKLTRHGNSMALVIDKPILDLLRIEPDTPLDVTTDGKRLVIEPARASARRRKFEQAMADVERKFGGAFKRLA
jgi:antitoxin component of MazEF toxin-antitoxin module